MSYHNVLSGQQSTTNAQGQTAPAGFHYMPDGTLMSDMEHAILYGGGTITGFNLDFSDIKAVGETRSFAVIGENGAVFSLEIKNEDNYYYNFQTNLFQATKTKLANIVIKRGSYNGNITFPTVTDADQYDFYLFAEQGTNHADYVEVKFVDNSVDINSSTGSRSNVLQKVIYQTLDLTITLSNYSPTGDTTPSSNTTQAITASGGKDVGEIQFEIKATVTSGALSIDRQPTEDDIIVFSPRVIGATPVNIPGENIYPTANLANGIIQAGDDSDIVNGAVRSGVKVVMDNNVADNMAVGDRITTRNGLDEGVTNNTVDGAVTSGVKVVMDSNVDTLMAVGDRITSVGHGGTGSQQMDYNLVTVAALDPDGDNVKEFSMSEEGHALADGQTLFFTPALNRKIVTVAALNPDTDNVKEFSMSEAIGIRDNLPLEFSNRRNYRWSVDNIDKLQDGMKTIPSTFFTTTPTLKEYVEQTTIFEGEKGEIKIDKVKVPPSESLGAKPVITRNASTKIATTVQTGNITFSEQALLTLGGTTANIYSYGPEEVNRLVGYDIGFSNLNVELNTISTTLTAAVSASTTIPVDSKVGIVVPTTQTVDGAITSSRFVVLDSVDGLSVGQSLYAVSSGSLSGVPTITAVNETTKRITLSSVQTFADGITLTFPNSIISGIGIASDAVDPYVASIASLNLTASAAQTLEDDQTFTFTGAGNIATITGSIRVNKVGNEDLTLYFDLDKFLTKHTN